MMRIVKTAKQLRIVILMKIVFRHLLLQLEAKSEEKS
jgi:hypothetical protein